MTIHQLAEIPQNATDKQNPDHTFWGKNYLHHYERHFEALRDLPVKLLEIGVHGGWSLRLWRDYFPKGEIHGFDINPECVDQKSDRISVHIMDQGNKLDLEVIASLGPWDIIIDDGSHYVPHILIAFSFLWPRVSPGGFYVMEDMRLSYANIDMTWPGMKHNTTIIDGKNHRDPINELLLERCKKMDEFIGNTAAMHLYPMIYFFEKIR